MSTATVKKKICDNILEAIGDTPMVRINRITQGVVKATVLAKIETFNPGNSIKDRMAVRMIEDAERKGLLKPGGTIIEGTSGNTGMGLAIAAVVKGYRCIFTTTDKQSKEKVDALKAFGAEVIVCPTNVDPEDPALVLLGVVAPREGSPELLEGEPVRQPVEHRGALRADRTGDLGADRRPGHAPRRRRRHRRHDQRRRHGTSRSATRSIKVWGIDTYGSVFKKYKETGIFDKNEIYPYITEGIGEDFLPKNVDFDVIDHFEKVTDKDAALMTRRIAREEGIFAGNSAGSAMAGLLQLKDHFTDDDVVVVIFHDHGSRYLGKMFNDDWMREKGFFEKSGLTARDLVASGVSGELLAIEGTEPVEVAVKLMGEHDFSQISITRDKRLVGSLNEAHLYDQLVRTPDVKAQPVETIMQPAFPFVDISTPVELLSTMITPANPGGAGPRLQDRQDLHHHALGRDPRAVLKPTGGSYKVRLAEATRSRTELHDAIITAMPNILVAGCRIALAGSAPAQNVDMSGTWDVTFNTQNGPMAASMTIKKEGEKLAGTMTGPQGDVAMEGHAEATRAVAVNLSVQTPNGQFAIAMSGTLRTAMPSAAPSTSADEGQGEWSGQAPGHGLRRVDAGRARRGTGREAGGRHRRVGVRRSRRRRHRHADGDVQAGRREADRHTIPRRSSASATSPGRSRATRSLRRRRPTFEGKAVKVTYSGTVEKDTMKGKVTFGDWARGRSTGKKK